MLPAPAYDLLYGGCAVLTFAIFVGKLRVLLRDPGDPVIRVVCLQFLFVSTAFAAAAPSVYVWLGDVARVVNVATLVVYVCIILCSACFQAMLLMWSHPLTVAVGQVRSRFLLYGALLAAMVVLFVVGDVGGEARPLDFDAHYAGDPAVAGFLLLYYGGFATVMGSAYRLGRRYARVAGRPWLVRGLRWVTAGAACALAYCVLKIASLVGTWAGLNLYDLNVTWAPLSASAGALLIAIGITMPAWGERLSDLSETARHVRSHRRLHPLWQAMYRATPSIALEPPDVHRSTRWALADVRHRLYRRVIEIHDGRLALRSYLDPHVAARARSLGEAAGHTGFPLRAIEEAALLATAANAKSAGWAPTPDRDMPPASHTGQENLDQEIRWLEQVSQAIRRSPVVRAVVAEHRREVPTSA